MTDDTDVFNERVEVVDGHFHSGDHHVLYDDLEGQSRTDPVPDPESCCIDCSSEGMLRCGSCGFPLCGMHHELGGGFCSSSTTKNGVPGCEIGDRFILAVPIAEEHEHFDEDVPTVLVTDESGHDVEVYHLPDVDGSDRPACRPHEHENKTSITIGEASSRELELCDHCNDVAVDSREASLNEQRESLSDNSNGNGSGSGVSHD